MTSPHWANAEEWSKLAGRPWIRALQTSMCSRTKNGPVPRATHVPAARATSSTAYAIWTGPPNMNSTVAMSMVAGAARTVAKNVDGDRRDEEDT